MTITYEGSAGGNNSSATPNPSYPATVNAGDLAVLHVSSGGSTNPTVDTPTGYTFLATANGGEGTYGTDVGPRRETLFYRICDGTEDSTSVSINITDGNTSRGQIFLYSKTDTNWDLDVATAVLNTNATSLSFVTDALAMTPNDTLFIGTSINNNGGDPSSPALSASGIGFGTVTEILDNAVNNGSDHRSIAHISTVSTGTADVAVTFDLTLSAAGSGATVILRIRETSGSGPTEVSATGIDRTHTLGTPTPTKALTVPGQDRTGTPGASGLTKALTVPGIGRTGAQGTATPLVEGGVSASGIDRTHTLGTPTLAKALTVPGQGRTGSQGTIHPTRLVPASGPTRASVAGATTLVKELSVAGVARTSQQGVASIPALVEITVSGLNRMTSTGTATISTSATLTLDDIYAAIWASERRYGIT